MTAAVNFFANAVNAGMVPAIKPPVKQNDSASAKVRNQFAGFFGMGNASNQQAALPPGATRQFTA